MTVPDDGILLVTFVVEAVYAAQQDRAGGGRFSAQPAATAVVVLAGLVEDWRRKKKKNTRQPRRGFLNAEVTYVQKHSYHIYSSLRQWLRRF